MKITTTETAPTPPPRIHTLELDDNELAILRYIANYYAAAAAAVTRRREIHKQNYNQ